MVISKESREACENIKQTIDILDKQLHLFNEIITTEADGLFFETLGDNFIDLGTNMKKKARYYRYKLKKLGDKNASDVHGILQSPDDVS